MGDLRRLTHEQLIRHVSSLFDAPRASAEQVAVPVLQVGTSADRPRIRFAWRSTSPPPGRAPLDPLQPQPAEPAQTVAAGVNVTYANSITAARVAPRAAVAQIA
jgi:hypothetical protein